MFTKLFVCLLVAGVLGDRELAPTEIECAQELNLNVDAIKKYTWYEHMPLDNENVLKMEDCWTKKVHLFNSENKMEFDVLRKLIQSHVATLTTPESADEKALAELYLSKMDACTSKTFEGTNAEIGLKFHNCVVVEMSKY